MSAPAVPLQDDPDGTAVPGPAGPPDRQSAAQRQIPGWLLTALTPDPDRLARGRALAARVRAAEIEAGRPWPPPVPPNPGQRLDVDTYRPLVVLGGVTLVGGCAGGDGVPCVPAPTGAWRCPECGAVTRIAEPVVGPRLPACACRGDDGMVCVHPSGARGPLTGTRGRR